MFARFASLTTSLIFFFLDRLRGVRLMTRNSKRNGRASNVWQNSPSYLVIQRYERVYSRNQCQVSRKDTVLSPGPIGDVEIITTPSLQYMVRRTYIGSSAATTTTLSRGVQVAIRRAIRGVMRSRSVVVRCASLVLNRCKGCVRRTSVRIPFGMLGVNVVRCHASLSGSSVCGFFSKGVGCRLVSKSR